MTTPWIKKIRIGLLALTCSSLVDVASAAQLDAIFVSQGTGEIDNITTTGTTSPSTTLYTATGHNWNGAAYDPQNGLIYLDDLGSSTNTINQIITNTIYSFNPLNPSAGVTLINTVSGQAAFTGGAFHNGLYYVIPNGSDQLISYSISGSTITQVSSQTLGGLGTGVAGLGLGDIDFVGSTLYISALKSNGTAFTSYELLKYTDVSNVSTPVYAVAESKSGVGISYDIVSGQLIMFNSDGTLNTVDPTTGAQTAYSSLSGPAASGGSGDFTIVPEPSTYAIWSMLLLGVLVAGHRKLRSGTQPCLA